MDTTGEVRPGSTVVVVTGGDPPEPAVVTGLPDDSLVVAADSGGDTARALGLAVHELVGDLDSLSAAGLEDLTRRASLEVYEPDKDATDLELAVAAALRHDPRRIVVLGGLGGRVDHELANLLLLSGQTTAGVSVVLHSGGAAVHVVRPGQPATVHRSAGALVSMLPVHGGASGVTTRGLRWPLHDASLPAGTTLGVSNELIGDRAEVTSAEGVLLVVQPGTPAGVVPPRSAPNPNPNPTLEVSE